MWLVSRVSIAVFFSALLFSLTSVVIGMPENTPLADWQAVPPQQAGIALAIDFPVSSAVIYSDGKQVAQKEWEPKILLFGSFEYGLTSIKFNLGRDLLPRLVLSPSSRISDVPSFSPDPGQRWPDLRRARRGHKSAAARAS
jgi:hypothetical protein